MTDEPKTKETPNGEWKMPEPVFRSSEGHTPAGIHATIPAEDGVAEFRNAVTEETPGLPPEEDFHQAKTVETKVPVSEADLHTAKTVETEGLPGNKVKAAPVKSKKGGCAKTFLLTVSLIGLGIATVIIALVYFLFYYRPAETGTF